jgi:oxalate---CoA ligase
MTGPPALAGAFGGHSQHPAILEPVSGSALSYAELEETVQALAGQLVAAGVAPGAPIALLSENGPEMIVAFLAVVAASGAAVPINPALTATEIGAMLHELGPQALIMDAAAGRRDITQLCDELGVRLLRLEREPHIHIDGERGQPAAVAPADPDAICLLLQTSGTTSRPKTVPLRQRNLAASARNIAAGYGLGAQDSAYCVMPLFHIHGLVASTLSTLVSGGTVVVPRRTRPSAFAEDLNAHRVTWVSAVPTLLDRLVSAAARAQVDAAWRPETLRFARTSSSALAPELASRAEEALGVPVLEAYGMTEASHQMASNPLPPAERRQGSVGLAVGTEIAVVDESWAPLQRGSRGEIVVKGPGVVDGYLNNDAANDASFRDGWFRTGDVGVLSADGYLSLVGRIKELINRAGEKIAPREIDEALLSHPSVREAVAYGVANQKYGEIVHAAVVTEVPISERELIDHCAERLAEYKLPERIVFLGEIPKGPTGKVQRTSLGATLAR